MNNFKNYSSILEAASLSCSNHGRPTLKVSINAIKNLLAYQRIQIPAKFVGACIAFFVMAFVYEGLKYYREVFFIKAEQSRRTVVESSDGEVITTPVKPTIKEQMLNAPHFYQTFLHLVQVFISYILMLIVMLCNLWLIFAICLGAAVGYFSFGWLRKITYRDANECCY